MTALPFVHLVAANPGQPLPTVLFAIYWVAITGPLAVLAWFGGERAAAATALTVYTFGYVAVTISNQLTGDASTAYLITVGLVLAGWLVTRWAPIRQAVPLLALLVVAVPAIQIVLNDRPAVGVASDAEPWPLTAEATPNIYWYVLDGFGRADALEGMGVSLSEPAFLHDAGFTISSRAVAHYPMSLLSIATTASGGYLVTGSDLDYLNSEPFHARIQGHNPVVATLRDWGYAYIHGPADQWGRCSGAEDICLDTAGIAEAGWALLQMTPFAGTISDHRVHDQRSDPLAITRQIIAHDPPAPFFVFVHLISPHPPYYRLGGDCELQNTEHNLSTSWGTTSDYAEAIDCLKRQLEATVDLILTEDPTAVIILQGDHGPGHGLDLNENALDLTSEEIRQRLGVFSAVRMPCPVPDDLALVNTFRRVLSCLSHENLELLAPRTWMVNYQGGPVVEVAPPQ